MPRVIVDKAIYHMPELHWLLGYPLSLTIMVIAVIIVHRLLRKNGWL